MYSLQRFDEVGQWKINKIKHFYLPQNTRGQENKTVSIVTDCLATVLIQGDITLVRTLSATCYPICALTLPRHSFLCLHRPNLAVSIHVVEC